MHWWEGAVIHCWSGLGFFFSFVAQVSVFCSADEQYQSLAQLPL